MSSDRLDRVLRIADAGGVGWTEMVPTEAEARSIVAACAVLGFAAKMEPSTTDEQAWKVARVRLAEPEPDGGPDWRRIVVFTTPAGFIALVAARRLYDEQLKPRGAQVTVELGETGYYEVCLLEDPSLPVDAMEVECIRASLRDHTPEAKERIAAKRRDVACPADREPEAGMEELEPADEPEPEPLDMTAMARSWLETVVPLGAGEDPTAANVQAAGFLLVADALKELAAALGGRRASDR